MQQDRGELRMEFVAWLLELHHAQAETNGNFESLSTDHGRDWPWPGQRLICAEI